MSEKRRVPKGASGLAQGGTVSEHLCLAEKAISLLREVRRERGEMGVLSGDGHRLRCLHDRGLACCSKDQVRIRGSLKYRGGRNGAPFRPK